MSSCISSENEILLKLLANSLFNSNLHINLSGVDLEKLFAESMSQTVIALAFDALPTEAEDYNSEIYKKWQMYSFKVIQKNTSQLYSNAKLEVLFTNANLDICTIKGFASAYYYPKKYLRQMGDIDFIVPIETIDLCKKLLSEADFECTDEDECHDFHIGYKKNDETYEMHKGITTFFDKNGYIEEYIKNIFTTSVITDFDGVKITIPDLFSHGLIMILHMQKHMIDGGGIGLRHLCDWAVFVNCFESHKWKNIFEKRLKEINLWKFAQAMSKVSNIYLMMPEQDWFAGVDDELAEELLYDIMLGGNFGRKDVKRYQELIFVSQSNKQDNKFKLQLRFYIKKVREWKPVFRKRKSLIFLGMIVYPFRTLFLILCGKKKNVLQQSYKSGNRRNSLYDKIFK